MNATLEKYLNTIDKHLKPIPASERADIVREIKGSILEMENENLATEEILERLGNPKELAKAYLGDLVSKGTGFSWNRFLTVCAFYSVVGFTGVVVIPMFAIMAPVFILCGAVVPLLGAVKLVNHLFNLNIPFAEQIQIGSGIAELSPIPAFFASIILGVVLYRAGRASWKFLLYYCKKVSAAKTDLYI